MREEQYSGRGGLPTRPVVGAVILAGGGSRRMGRDKARLPFRAETFLEHISGELSGFDECLLSVADAVRYPVGALTVVRDQFPDSGAMGGICSALSACCSDALFVTACDTPLVTEGLARYLCAFLSPAVDAVVAETRDGRAHPLCAVYTKAAGAVFAEQIAAGNLRMRDALAHMRVKYAPLWHSAYPDEALTNINTPQEYAALRRRLRGPAAVAVSGVKNSGKTTFLEGLLPVLRREGLRVAVVKHDGHDFTPDVPGTDSFRARMAGAEGVAVYSEARFLLTREWAREEPERLFAAFPDMDLILLEGGKGSRYRKIEVLRAAVSAEPVCAAETLLALCTDTGVRLPGVPALGLADYEAAARLILSWLAGNEAVGKSE